MSAQRHPDIKGQQFLFDSTSVPLPPTLPKVGIKDPIWTESKADLIARYLYYFVLITKHGTYIDGFAGPQQPDKPKMWSAKLVLESTPRWLRHFFLFDSDTAQIKRLNELVDSLPKRQPKEPKRIITVRKGDFNVEIQALLASNAIPEKEASFCLLDQRTFECHWSTVKRLAGHKRAGRKIELFYFLPHSWLARAVAGVKNTKMLEDWWGRADWEPWTELRAWERKEAFRERFTKELGYQYAYAWPIYDSPERGRRIMYFMIHATDHPSAPPLMERAYRRAVHKKESQQKCFAEFGIEPE